MKTKYLITSFFICMIIYLSPAVSMAAVRQESIVYSNGKLSASLRQASFNDIITFISEKTGIRIYIFDDTDNKTLTLEFSGRSLESGLRSVLKEVNYAIVYQSGLEKGNVKWMSDASQKRNRSHGSTISGRSTGMTKRADDMPSWYHEGMSYKEAKLRGRIDDLERQIESGYADAQYNSWVKIRGEKNVRHASELLEEYEDRLEALPEQ